MLAETDLVVEQGAQGVSKKLFVRSRETQARYIRYTYAP